MKGCWKPSNSIFIDHWNGKSQGGIWLVLMIMRISSSSLHDMGNKTSSDFSADSVKLFHVLPQSLSRFVYGMESVSVFLVGLSIHMVYSISFTLKAFVLFQSVFFTKISSRLMSVKYKNIPIS
jgi:hypothetical protein